MKNRRDIIYSILLAAFSPSHLQVIDESEAHIGHAGHQGGGRHFAIKIASSQLNQLSRIEAHRRIYAELSNLMIHDIHALRIQLLNEPVDAW